MSAKVLQMQEEAASTTVDDRMLPIVAEIGATIPKGSTCIMKLSLARTSDDQGRFVKPREDVPFTSQPSGGWDDATQYQMQFAYRLQHKLSNFMTDRQVVYSFDMLQFIQRFTQVAPDNGMAAILPLSTLMNEVTKPEAYRVSYFEATMIAPDEEVSDGRCHCMGNGWRMSNSSRSKPSLAT